MAFMGIHTGHITRGFRDNKAAWPSIMALLAVAGLWVAATVGGVGFLTEARTPLGMLTGLYVGLAFVAVSIIITTLALIDLVSRYSPQRTEQ